MDIQKDIEKFRALGYNALAQDFKKEAESLRVKTYLFRSINTINELDDLIKNDFFKEQNITYIRLYPQDDLDLGFSFSKVELFDANKQQIDTKMGNSFINEYIVLSNLFGYYTFPLEKDLCNIILDNGHIELELNNKTKNELRNYLFNSELKKAYDYITMLDKVPEKTSETKLPTRKI